MGYEGLCIGGIVDVSAPPANSLPLHAQSAYTVNPGIRDLGNQLLSETVAAPNAVPTCLTSLPLTNTLQVQQVFSFVGTNERH